MMFTKVRCWDPARALDVLNTEAEAVDDATFQFVHTERRLLIRSGASGVEWDASRLLKEILNPNYRHILAVVTGESGSGKSHLIHWLSLQIPSKDEWTVVVVPRSGITLRGVIERLLSVLPEADQRPYRDRLDQAGFDQATLEERRERVLFELAQATRSLQPDPAAPDMHTAAYQQDLINDLHTLLLDQSYQPLLLVDGGVVDRLARRIGERGRLRDDDEEEFEFSTDDFRISDVRENDLSAPARHVFQPFRKRPPFLLEAAALMNRAVNPGVGRVLNFTGDQLNQLMLDIRRSLKRRGKSLVLLIEDFARAKGIDGALLDALEDQADDRGHRDLCELRTVMAVTTGYLERLPDTFQTRITHRVDIDVSPLPGQTQADQFGAFAVRYLDAARLSAATIEAWSREALDTRQANRPVACNTCQYRQPCHEAFGAVDGIGLYPFNSAALVTAAENKEVLTEHKFNPRRLMQQVLKPVLSEYSDELPDGEFPSETLLNVLGGQQFWLGDVQRIRNAAGMQAGRVLAIQALWGNPTTLVPVPDGVYEAFGVRKPHFDTTAMNMPNVVPIPVNVGGPDSDLLAISAWVRGETMPQSTAHILRELVFNALDSFIDWDSARLLKPLVSERKGGDAMMFRQTGIGFTNQATNFTATGVRLLIPGENPDTRAMERAGLALTGLVQAKRTGGWRFPDAAEHQVALGICLEEWGRQVIDAVRTYAGRATAWRPDVVALELLLVGAALGRGPINRQVEDLTLMEAVFGPWPGEADLWNDRLARVFRDIREKRSELLKFVKRQHLGSKGGFEGFPDVEWIVQTAHQFMRTWRLTAVPESTDTDTGALGQLRSLRRQVANNIEERLRVELERRQQWYKRIQESAVTGDLTGLGKAGQNLVETMRAEAIPMPEDTMRNATQALEALREFGEIRTLFEQIQADDESDPFLLLPRLRRRSRTVMETADNAIVQLKLLVRKANQSIVAQGQSLGVSMLESDAHMTSIKKRLVQLAGLEARAQALGLEGR